MVRQKYVEIRNFPKFLEIIEENHLLKDKNVALETEKTQLSTEKQHFKLQVDNICNILTSETKEKEHYKQELEALNHKIKVFPIFC